jgi:hypothetical protein
MMPAEGTRPTNLSFAYRDIFQPTGIRSLGTFQTLGTGIVSALGHRSAGHFPNPGHGHCFSPGALFQPSRKAQGLFVSTHARPRGFTSAPMKGKDVVAFLAYFRSIFRCFLSFYFLYMFYFFIVFLCFVNYLLKS